MNILGVHIAFNQLNHDPGAALVCDQQLVAICEEERFNRIKTSRGCLPYNSIQAVLKEASLKIQEIDLVVTTGLTRKGQLEYHVSRFFQHYFGHSPKIEFVEHQMAHLSSSFFFSDFEEAMCVSCDGIGDGSSGKLAKGKGRHLDIIGDIPPSQSLGNFYSAITALLGFRQLEDEYKVMGLSSYGAPTVDFSEIISFGPDSYRINEEIFFRGYKPMSLDEPIYSDKLVKLLGPVRTKDEKITQRHKDIAFGAQNIVEECLIRIVSKLHKKTGLRKLCLSGGVALNCLANQKLEKLAFVDQLFVQPASSDRGLALGCALFGAQRVKKELQIEKVAYYGPTYSRDEYVLELENCGVTYREVTDPAKEAAQMIADGKIIGWFQGRSEFGPRALGNRSILADPRKAEMKDRINSRVKFREEFRPFAPAVIESRASEIFDIPRPSPFMTVTYPVRPEWCKKLSAITHIDNTARVQTVDRQDNPLFFDLITCFEQITQVPVVLNTSFNARGEPIVETPANAVATYFSTGIDALFLGSFLVEKPGLGNRSK